MKICDKNVYETDKKIEQWHEISGKIAVQRNPYSMKICFVHSRETFTTG